MFIAFWDALFYAMCFQLTNPASEDIAFTNVYFTLTAHFSTPGLDDHFQGLKIITKRLWHFDKLQF